MENRLQSRLGRGGLIIDACRKRVYESSLLKSNLFLNIMRGRAISTEKLSCGNIKSERELIVMKMRKLMKVWSIQDTIIYIGGKGNMIIKARHSCDEVYDIDRYWLLICDKDEKVLLGNHENPNDLEIYISFNECSSKGEFDFKGKKSDLIATVYIVWTQIGSDWPNALFMNRLEDGQFEIAYWRVASNINSTNDILKQFFESVNKLAKFQVKSNADSGKLDIDTYMLLEGKNEQKEQKTK